jgi:hypothetical protein
MDACIIIYASILVSRRRPHGGDAVAQCTLGGTVHNDALLSWWTADSGAWIRLTHAVLALSAVGALNVGAGITTTFSFGARLAVGAGDIGTLIWETFAIETLFSQSAAHQGAAWYTKPFTTEFVALAFDICALVGETFSRKANFALRATEYFAWIQ